MALIPFSELTTDQAAILQGNERFYVKIAGNDWLVTQTKLFISQHRSVHSVRTPVEIDDCWETLHAISGFSKKYAKLCKSERPTSSMKFVD